jgi:ketosteroid isomerase-like protein
MPAKNGKAGHPIRRVLDHWAEALRAKDIDGVMSHYASDIAAFDLALSKRNRRPNSANQNPRV